MLGFQGRDPNGLDIGNGPCERLQFVVLSKEGPYRIFEATMKKEMIRGFRCIVTEDMGIDGTLVATSFNEVIKCENFVVQENQENTVILRWHPEFQKVRLKGPRRSPSERKQ